MKGIQFEEAVVDNTNVKDNKNGLDMSDYESLPKEVQDSMTEFAENATQSVNNNPQAKQWAMDALRRSMTKVYLSSGSKVWEK